MNPDCHFGDHSWMDNGYCAYCPAFNGGFLQWRAIEKAQREGRHHGNHFHRTLQATEACPRKTHPEQPCADKGGCFTHEASEQFMETLDV